MTKTVFITGASRGIGRAAAEHFVEQGWDVVGTSTTGSSPKLSVGMTLLRLRLEDEVSIASCVEEMVSHGKTPDVLINNAAINPGIDDEFLDIAKVRQTVEVNLLGLISLTEKLLPHLLPHGRVINLTSSAANVNNQYIRQSLTPYSVAKAGVNLYTHNLSKRFKEQGLVAVALQPGWVKTDMGSTEAPKVPDDVAEELWELATADIQTGTLWENREIINWR